MENFFFQKTKNPLGHTHFTLRSASKIWSADWPAGRETSVNFRSSVNLEKLYFRLQNPINLFCWVMLNKIKFHIQYPPKLLDIFIDIHFNDTQRIMA